ncbi:MAG: hypothetical protein FWD62_01615 [Betaproteobacteria bacterium]|nr:hypothetical protein [Betaproteobacteria bacterium]
MNLEYLNKFCANKANDAREKLWKPFIQGGYAIATNGAIAVRVNLSGIDHGRTDRSANDTWPNVNKRIEEVKTGGMGEFDAFACLELIPLPELPPAEPCHFCDGTGKAYRCDECDGVGDFEHGNHLYDCKECGGCGQLGYGEGEAVSCMECAGLGEKPYCPVKVGNASFDRRFLALIAPLPNVMIAPNGTEKAAYFQFDGGDGALMPMRY